MTCICPVVKLNKVERPGTPEAADGPRNWNTECKEHGVRSKWYRSDEQVEKRRVDDERLRGLQAEARAARARRSSALQAWPGMS